MTTPAPVQGLPPEKAEEGQSNTLGALRRLPDLVTGIDVQVGENSAPAAAVGPAP